MRFEFFYVVLALIFSAIYYLLHKKNIFDKHVHSYVLVRFMAVTMVLNILFGVLCLIMLLTINGVASGLEIRYALDLFQFLLQTPVVTTKAMLWMNVAVYILEVITMVVATKISVKRRGHKNLKLERTLTSNCVVCVVFTILSTLELGFGFLMYI